jgi:hypothetical protein
MCIAFRQSVIGIIYYDGAEEAFHKLVEAVSLAKICDDIKTVVTLS